MHIYLFRHGVAHDRNAPDCPPDPERVLTADGQLKTRQAARGLRRLHSGPLAIRSSPYARARQTAAIVASELGIEPERVAVDDSLAPNGDVVKCLAHLDDDCLLVGHAPHLDLLLAAATGHTVPFTAIKKAGAALLEGSATSFQLLWLLPPRVLRRLAEGDR